MTPAQKGRVLKLLEGIQDLRRAADKEAAKGLTGVAAFNCSIQIDDAVWGLLYAERSISSLLDKDEWLAGLTKEQRVNYGFRK